MLHSENKHFGGLQIRPAYTQGIRRDYNDQHYFDRG